MVESRHFSRNTVISRAIFTRISEANVDSLMSFPAEAKDSLLTFSSSSRTPVAQPFLPCPEDELADFRETALLRRFSIQFFKAEGSL